MATIPIPYFQAGATAIPAILIALAVGAKHGTTWAARMQKESKRARIGYIVVLMVVVVAIGGGEFSAILALFANHGSLFQAHMVWGGVTLGLLLLIMELITPVIEVLTARERSVLLFVMATLWILACFGYIAATYLYPGS